MSRFNSKNLPVKNLISRANSARDAGAYAVAASLYEAALDLGGSTPRIHMQCGHMHKEARNLEAAVKHYEIVLEATPSDREIHLQLGHYYKTVGRYSDAETFYKKALELSPSWDLANEELLNLRKNKNFILSHDNVFSEKFDVETKEASVFVDTSLFPGRPDHYVERYSEEFVITRMGGHQRTRWGEGSTVRGIDALRGYILSDIPYLRIEIYVDGRLVYNETLQPATLDNPNAGSFKKYVYNAWIDFSEFSYGWHDITLRAVNVRGDSRGGLDWRSERLIVAPPLADGVFADSDSIIPPQPEEGRMAVADWVNSLPSVAHKASSDSFPVQPKKVLVQRLDQLGDLSVSVPALRRLRHLIPDAHIVGLLSPSNEGLGRSLGVFDEVIVADVPDDAAYRRRVIDREGQLALARRLAPYKFDVAVDLAVAGVTHQLLPLSGAPVLVSYGGAGWKTIGLDMATRDPKSGNDTMRHAARTRMLIEALGVWLNSGAEIVTRDDLSRTQLEAFGIDPKERFVVLHAGARIKFTRWPYFSSLAERLIRETDLKVVVMSDGDGIEERLAQIEDPNERLVVMQGKLDFDDFDAFLSFAEVFVGNDSGPKHLAALRGTNVVSIHSSRINWSEWGQELTGVVMSRKVPCAGCSLHHNSEECARDVVCVTKITVEEVFKQVSLLLN